MTTRGVSSLLLGVLLAITTSLTAARAASVHGGSQMPASHPHGAPPPGACGGVSCSRALLAMLNAQRAHAGVAPLQLVPLQSRGWAGCAGSLGHSTAMAHSGQTWHVNPRYPRASFPHDVCVPFIHSGENVGKAFSGNVARDLATLHRLMMSEPHGSATCATTINHACTILDPTFHRVGIGIYLAAGATWLTEDFVG